MLRSDPEVVLPALAAAADPAKPFLRIRVLMSMCAFGPQAEPWVRPLLGNGPEVDPTIRQIIEQALTNRRPP